MNKHLKKVITPLRKIKTPKIKSVKIRPLSFSKVKSINLKKIRILKLNHRNIFNKKKIKGHAAHLHSSTRSRFKNLSRVGQAILILVLLYVIGGLVVANQVYRGNDHSSRIDKALAIYPLPAARVNNHFISVASIYSQIDYVEQYSKQSCQADSSSCAKIDSYKTIRDRALDQQIENEIVAQAASKLSVSVSNKDIDKAYKKISDENGGDKKVKEVLQTLYGMTPKEFKVLLSTQILRDEINNKAIQRVDVSHILVADEAKAKSIISDIQGNKISFSDAAKQYSKDDKTSQKSGELGNLAQGDYEKDFQPVMDIAFNKAKVGKVYGQPIKTNYGYDVVLVNKKTGTIKSNFTDWLAGIKKKAKVVKFLK